MHVGYQWVTKSYIGARCPFHRNQKIGGYLSTKIGRFGGAEKERVAEGV